MSGITQILSIGAQDAFITGNPEVSFFRSTYKRHTNFSQVVQRQVIQGNPSNSGMSTIRFERKGDMLGYIFLTAKTSAGEVKDFYNDIDHIDLLIGGQVVDTQYLDFIVGCAPLLSSTQSVAQLNGSNKKIFPLRFWFCENWQSALPIVSLNYHDVEVRIYWNTVQASVIYECWANYVYLDSQERMALSSPSATNHLMYQVQRQPLSGLGTQLLVFNHPVKCLVASFPILDQTSYTKASLLKLQINGVDIGDEKMYTPHFDLVPTTYCCPFVTNIISQNNFIYSFCLDMSKIQPSGTLNFSRVDSARLVSSNDTFTTGNSRNYNVISPRPSYNQYIYAVNYNILKIEKGMGGLVYAN